MNVRDIISSIIFYAGVVCITLLLIRVGSRYSFAKVHQEFRGMEPRLQRGDHVFLDKGIRRPEQLEYGDIIMYRRPLWKRGAFDYEFARVMGKPGDVVSMSNHKLYRAEGRAGELLTEEPVGEPYLNPRDRPEDFSPFVVPRNTVLVMHDNRRKREPLRNLLVPVRAIRGRTK